MSGVEFKTGIPGSEKAHTKTIIRIQWHNKSRLSYIRRLRFGELIKARHNRLIFYIIILICIAKKIKFDNIWQYFWDIAKKLFIKKKIKKK